MTVRLTRDSVAMGDDIDAPHEREVEVPSFLDPVALARHLRAGYLPGMCWGGHSWGCLLNGRRIATVTVWGVTPDVATVDYAESNEVHFSYTTAQAQVVGDN